MIEGDVFESLPGQERVIHQLRAASHSPVHAYLFVGPPGSGKRIAARAFAASLLCPNVGCGECDVCRRVSAGTHRDAVFVGRTGPYITVAQAREIQRVALLTPNEGTRKVMVLSDFHLVREAGPTLLKIIEEPPASTVFVILAESLPPELVTIASRCVQISFESLPAGQLAELLVREGVEAEMAQEVVAAAGGRIDRARRLASDPTFAARRGAWQSVPSRLDGTGSTVAILAADLVEAAGAAAQAVADAMPVDESATKKEAGERQRRELRRLRMDEFDLGLATLAAAYREALASRSVRPDEAGVALAAIQSAASALARNPNETLLFQSLLLRLPPLRRPAPAPAG